MRRIALVLTAWCGLVMAACGGGTGSPGGPGTAGTGGAGGSGGTTGGGAGGGSSCASAVATQRCSAEGAICGAENCPDICQFCSILRCTSGVWQQNEVAPAPCFQCGTDLQCHGYTEYCEIAVGGDGGISYRCPALPSTCQSAPTCACLVSAGAFANGDCFKAAEGALIVSVPAP